MDRKIFSMAWPAALESLFVGAVELVDTAMVSSLGLAAVAAVGITSQPKRILLMFFLALNVGASALVSRRIGQGEHQEANRCMHRFLVYCLLLAALLYTGGFLLARPFLIISGANAEFLEDAVVYFRILVVGQFFQALSLTINACLRAEGRTRVTLQTNVAANLINLVFNYFLIYGKCGFPRLEVAGAAIATSLGSAAAFLISLWSIRRGNRGILHLCLERTYWRLDLKALPGIWPVTFSAFQEQFFQRLGLFLYTRLAAGLGTAEFALYQFVMNLANLQGYTYDGFAVTATAMTGQSLGARKPEAAEQSTYATLRLAYGTAALIAVFLTVGRGWILGFFSDEAYIIQEGSYLLLFVAASCLPCAGASTYAGALRGAGDTKAVAWHTLLSTAVFRPILAWLLCTPCALQQSGIWIAFFAAHFLRCLLLRSRYRKGEWRTISL